MKKVIFYGISMLLSISAIAQNSTVLKYNLEKNKIYRIKSTSEQTITQTMGGMSQTSQVTSNMVTSIKMVDSKSEYMVAEIRFDTISNVTNAMGKTTAMSSVNEGNIKSETITEVMNGFMNRMSKNALFVKLNYSGKVLEIINIKAFSDIVLKDIDSLNMDGPMASMVPTQVKNMVEEKSLKTMIETTTNYLPGKSVAIGAKWDVSNTMSSGGMLFTINNSFKLENINKNIANVSSEATIVPSSTEPMSMMGTKISYSELKGQSKSTIIIDATTGVIKESTGKTSMSGNLGVEVPGNSMQIPMEIKGETKVVALP
jgi:hypothetical protein